MATITSFSASFASNDCPVQNRSALTQEQPIAVHTLVNYLKAFLENPHDELRGDELWEALLKFVGHRRPRLNSDRLFLAAWDSLLEFVNAHVATGRSHSSIDEYTHAIGEIIFRSLQRLAH